MNDTTAETQASSLDKVLTALATLGEATAAAIAEQAGLGYSTTTPKLRALEDAEQAERFRNGDGRTLWRLTTAGRAAVEAAAQADPGAVAPDERINPSPDNSEPDSAGTQSAQPDSAPSEAGNADVPVAEVGGQPVDTLDDAAGRPRVAPAGAADQQPDRDTPQTGGHADDSPDPDSAGTQSAQPDSAPSEAGNADVPASGPTDQPAAEPASATTSRRSGGTLRGTILDFLEAHPDEQYKISELCKLIDKANEGSGAAKASAGAVANAAIKLVGAHRVIQTVERPATFQFAPPTD